MHGQPPDVVDHFLNLSRGSKLIVWALYPRERFFDRGFGLAGLLAGDEF